MSKHLIKILSICALVVLVPLIVVGSAITVTQAAPATLTIYQGGNDGQYAGKSSTISILIDGVPQVDGQGQPVSTITVKKHSTVAVHYEGTGYEFAGWYDGTAQEVDGTEFVALVNARDYHKPGDKVKMGFDVNKAHFFDKDTTKAIVN